MSRIKALSFIMSWILVKKPDNNYKVIVLPSVTDTCAKFQITRTFGSMRKFNFKISLHNKHTDEQNVPIKVSVCPFEVRKLRNETFSV